MLEFDDSGDFNKIYTDSINDPWTVHTCFANHWSSVLNKLKSSHPNLAIQTQKSKFLKPSIGSTNFCNPAEIIQYIPSFAGKKKWFNLKQIHKSNKFNAQKTEITVEIYEKISQIDAKFGQMFRVYPILLSLHNAPIFHWGYSYNETVDKYKVKIYLY